MYRVITISREFGSGGAVVGSLVAQQLGWRFLDSIIINQAAERAQVPATVAQSYDERLDSWLHRISKRTFARDAIERVPVPGDLESFDADMMANLTREIFSDAAEQGNAVLIGRGGQCVLRQRRDTLHVFVYAPRPSRLKRIRQRMPHEQDPEGLMDLMDRTRDEYIRTRHGCDWRDPRLYHLMINTCIGEQRAANAIIAALKC
jgi:cytidylate kinase